MLHSSTSTQNIKHTSHKGAQTWFTMSCIRCYATHQSRAPALQQNTYRSTLRYAVHWLMHA